LGFWKKWPFFMGKIGGGVLFLGFLGFFKGGEKMGNFLQKMLAQGYFLSVRKGGTH
jgi:hypothetical protein